MLGSSSTPKIPGRDRLPTSTFTSFPDSVQNRPRNRLVASILLDTSLTNLSLVSNFVRGVGVNTKGHGYRLLGGIKPVFTPKDLSASRVAGKHLEWETVARARVVSSELLTRVIFETFQGEIVGTRPFKRPESGSSRGNKAGKYRDEATELLERNNNLDPPSSPPAGDEEKKVRISEEQREVIASSDSLRSPPILTT